MTSCVRCRAKISKYYFSTAGLIFCGDCTRDIAVSAVEDGLITHEYLLAKHVREAKP